MNPKYAFQYCQKIVLFSEDKSKLFLAKRKDEADYDGTFALIGGKMENSDRSIVEGLKREKDEEIGNQTKIRIYPESTHNLLYKKNDGSMMILPHYLAYFVGGKIELNEGEYSEYIWLPLNELEYFEPKIENIPGAVQWALHLSKSCSSKDFIDI